jgi:glycerol-3-phosphate dehydrogenase (NAD(P)+)
MIAEDILSDQPTSAILAGPENNEELHKILTSDQFKTIFSTDIHGVAISGILKNIYTLFLSGLDTLAMGTNLKGVAVTNILKEGMDIIKELGGKPETFLSLAGIGDLITTSNSPHSSHAHIGAILALRQEEIKDVEAIRSLPIIVGKTSKKYPILTLTQKLIESDIRKEQQTIVQTLLSN